MAGHVAETLIQAHAVYGGRRYRDALRRLGDFLKLAQMPDPQPAWAQQYNHQMDPIWARRFEPAAISGGESQDVIRALLRTAYYTGDATYLRPIPRAIDYLRRSQLPDGRLARFYELRTNRPLYMQRRGDEYHLTYDDHELPGHYSWKVPSHLDDLQKQLDEVKRGEWSRPERGENRQRVKQVIEALDGQGRWISTYEGERLASQPKLEVGRRFLSSAVFGRNVSILSRFLEQHRSRSPAE